MLTTTTEPPSTIVTPQGDPATVPTVLLSAQDADLLRRYKKFLAAQGLREALYCNACWDKNLSDGTEAYVTGTQIVIRCRCRLRFYGGTSA